MRPYLLVFLTAVLISLALGLQVTSFAQLKNFKPVTDEMLQNPDPADWINWRRTQDAWGYSPLKQINKQNVGRLQLAWSWAMAQGDNESGPLVYDGVMFLPGPRGVVQALDAATGDFLWEYKKEFEEPP